MPNETADASVVNNGTPAPASDERQHPKKKTFWPWFTALGGLGTSRSRQAPITSVSARDESVTGAEVLVAYAIRNNVQDVQDAIETVADSRDLLEKRQLSGEAQKKFYEAFAVLASQIAPVTVASLKASLDEYGKETRLFPWDEPKRLSYARLAARRKLRLGLMILVVLLWGQFYWAAGTNLIRNLTLPQTAASLPSNGSPPLNSTPSTVDYDQQLMLARQLRTWYRPFAHPPLHEPKDVKAKPGWIKQVVVGSLYVADVFQQFVLPMLYGGLGAIAYALRTLAQQSRDRLYRVENETADSLRTWLGVIAGLAIGWFFAPDKSTGAGLGALSPLALAFVAGYSVDLLFTAMDRLVAAFSGPAPTQPDQSGSRPSQLPKPAISSINSPAALPAAAAV
jgi:hypothetical protein